MSDRGDDSGSGEDEPPPAPGDDQAALLREIERQLAALEDDVDDRLSVLESEIDKQLAALEAEPAEPPAASPPAASPPPSPQPPPPPLPVPRAQGPVLPVEGPRGDEEETPAGRRQWPWSRSGSQLPDVDPTLELIETPDWEPPADEPVAPAPAVADEDEPFEDEVLAEEPAADEPEVAEEPAAAAAPVVAEPRAEEPVAEVGAATEIADDHDDLPELDADEELPPLEPDEELPPLDPDRPITDVPDRTELELEIDRQLAALLPDDDEELDEAEDVVAEKTAAEEDAESADVADEDEVFLEEIVVADDLDLEDAADTEVDDAVDMDVDVEEDEEADDRYFVPTQADVDEAEAEAAEEEAADDWATTSLATMVDEADEGGEPPTATKKRRRGWALIAAGVAIAVAGVALVVATRDDDPSTDASGSPDVTATTGPGGVTVPPVEHTPEGEAALEYLTIYATQDADRLEDMFDLSAKGSPARAYAVHQEALAKIDPEPNAPLQVTDNGATIELCTDEQGVRECTVYSDFRIDDDGKLTEFSADGKPLRDRIALGGDSVTVAGPMEVRIVSVYVSATDRLFVVYTVRNRGDDDIQPEKVAYAFQGVEEMQPVIDTFVSDIHPGDTRTQAAAFPTQARGGVLVVVSESQDSQGDHLIQMTVP